MCVKEALPNLLNLRQILQDRTAKMAAFNLASTKGVKELVDAVSLLIQSDFRERSQSGYPVKCTRSPKSLTDVSPNPQRQAEISADMQKNAQTTANQLELVPVRASATVTKAITDSTDAAKKAAAKGINESGKYLARKFTDTSSLVSGLQETLLVLVEF